MSLDLHESPAVDEQRTCLPKPALSILHDDHAPSFGRWLGQINAHD